MKAEILFPEVCNLYGDLQNIYYLKRCCPALEIIETDLSLIHISHSFSKSRAGTLEPRPINAPNCSSIVFKGRSMPSNMLRMMPGPRVTLIGPPVATTGSPGVSPVVSS